LGVAGAIPIAFLEAGLVYAWTEAGGVDATTEPNKNQHLSAGKAIGVALFMAFLVAGFCEESLKYVLVRRMYNRPIYTQPRGLVIVGLAGALGFATIENIGYVLSYGIVSAVVRAVVSVPLHALTGLIMGTKLAKHKYFPSPGQIPLDNHLKLYASIVWLPILIHGCFNFPIMALAFANPKDDRWQIVQICPVIVVLIALACYIKFNRELTPGDRGGRGDAYATLPQDPSQHPLELPNVPV
jgi:RsiW-degrading membrane proteinase PrsW (M82 family)